MEDIKCKIYVPSYSRSDSICTKKFLKDAVYVVRKTQKEDYLKAGIKEEDLWAVDDELIDSNVKVYYYIINNAEEDVVVIADDDIEKFVYRMNDVVDIYDEETVLCEIERIGQLLVDLDLGYACVDNNAIPYGYDREVAFKGIPGSLSIINRAKFKAKIDEKVKYNFDIDIVMQELVCNRIVLLEKYFKPIAKIDTNKGGDSSKKRQQQIDSIRNMKVKWGKYFEYDFKKNKPKINVKR